MNRKQRRAETKQIRQTPRSAASNQTSALFGMAATSYAAGRFAEAEDRFRQILAIDPDHVDSLHYLGILAFESGRADFAAETLGRALALRSDDPLIYSNLGNALKAQGKLDEAEAAFRRALALRPGFADAYVNLGEVLRRRGKLAEAVIAYRRALELKPRFAEAYNNLGVALGEQGEVEEAAQCYERAIALEPDFAVAHSNLGDTFRSRRKLNDAAMAYRRALALNPNLAEAHLNLGNVLKAQRKLDAAAASYERALAIRPDYLDAHSNLLVCLQYSTRIDANADILAAARRFGARFARPGAVRPFPNDRSPGRRLRIGYVSGDFRRHPVGFFLARVLETHDRMAVETFCYANDDGSDAMTERLRAASGHWRAIAKASDAEAAALILRDGIDILIDLSGHTAKNRLPLFALRPAPVQVSWLGYFGTTGLDAIDYLLMDDTAVPAGEERWYGETVVRLPYGRFCYAPSEYAPALVEPAAFRNGFVTFGSFNDVSKINADVVSLWAEVLRATPGSRLLLKWKSLDDDDERRDLRAAFAAAGVAGERLELRGFSPHPEMLAQYGDVDVALDPFPFGGGLTSCEAMWMGIPVVTLAGNRPISRQTAGFLAAIGLTNCVAPTPAAYVRLASALASNRSGLATLRRNLRSCMAASPLCDGAVFTPTLEVAFRQMWNRGGGGGGVAPAEPERG